MTIKVLFWSSFTPVNVLPGFKEYRIGVISHRKNDVRRLNDGFLNVNGKASGYEIRFNFLAFKSISQPMY